MVPFSHLFPWNSPDAEWSVPGPHTCHGTVFSLALQLAIAMLVLVTCFGLRQRSRAIREQHVW
ncbi:hypothetical protein CC77DRAFT_1025828 [Alternaria alternata]|jgi:hypothetical protein|uniref:Uncharacterized protein n=1 Tax=Alternaria alternata TaxID=5599 RepID=A0A177D664_ALTAL|nr:hypothetical protein CC77DRAFT_1025828 [Alternaria alternata]OAG14429.1 hypothetical protein CC77DRAFT_1025828 [Alternaria alternata]